MKIKTTGSMETLGQLMVTAVLGLSLLGIAACEDDDGAIENAGEEVQDAADDAADAVEDAVD